MEPSVLLKEMNDVLPQIIRIRRDLHAHPELSGHEHRTAGVLHDFLESVGAENFRSYENCFGFSADLCNGEGPCVAVRAEMDALPVQEATELPFASENPGVMHACGHDIHMALAAGSALWLQSHRELWHGRVRFLFEPCEETTGGGKLMTEQGCMKGPDVRCVLGQHVAPGYAVGTFFSGPGYVSGSSDELELTIHGKACHGAYPQRGADAIVIASQTVVALQQLVSRTISPFTPAVITIGSIHGGTAGNVVADTVRMKGILRTLDDDTRQKLRTEITRTVELTAAAMGGTGEVEILPSYGPVFNDEKLYAVAERQAVALLGQEHVLRRSAPSLGVESFSYFSAAAPGVYYDIGSGLSSALHSPDFIVEEEPTLLLGTALQVMILCAVMEEI